MSEFEVPSEEQREQQKKEYEKRLRQYGQEFYKAVQAEYPLSQVVRAFLEELQRQLGLTEEDIRRVEDLILESTLAYQERKQYRKLKQKEITRHEERDISLYLRIMRDKTSLRAFDAITLPAPNDSTDAGVIVSDDILQEVNYPQKLLRYPNLECKEKPIINQAFSLFVQLLIEQPQSGVEGLFFEDTGEPDKLPDVEVI
jgi:hypothetical protein